MQQETSDEWVILGPCPICEQGLRRLRTCRGDGVSHFYAVCDECEAVWTEPVGGVPTSFADPEHAKCPVCGQPMYGENSHWTTFGEVTGTKWQGAVTLHAAPSNAPKTPEEE